MLEYLQNGVDVKIENSTEVEIEVATNAETHREIIQKNLHTITFVPKKNSHNSHSLIKNAYYTSYPSNPTKISVKCLMKALYAGVSLPSRVCERFKTDGKVPLCWSSYYCCCSLSPLNPLHSPTPTRRWMFISYDHGVFLPYTKTKTKDQLAKKRCIAAHVYIVYINIGVSHL